MLLSRERKRTYLSSGMQANLSRERRRTLLSWTVSAERHSFQGHLLFQTFLYRQSKKCGNAIGNCLPTQIELGQKVSAAPRKPFTRNQMCKSPACLPDQHTSEYSGFQAFPGEQSNLKPQGTIN